MPTTVYNRSLLVLATLSIATAASAQVDPAELRRTAEERARRSLGAAEQQVFANMERLRLATRLTETESLLSQVRTLEQSFEQEVQNLLTSDDGKRIAMVPGGVAYFINREQHPPIDQAELARLESFVKETKELLERAGAGPDVSFTPSAATMKQAEGAYFWATDRLRTLRNAAQWLAHAQRTSRDRELQPDTLTLQAAIASVKAGEQQTRVEIIEGSRERALREENERLKQEIDELEQVRASIITNATIEELEGDITRLKKEVDRRRSDRVQQDQIVDAGHDKKQEQTQAEIDRAREAAERARLNRLCEDEANRRLLRPFTTRGYWQPGDGRGKQRSELQPMSYATLIDFGALDESEKGLKLLTAVANAKGCTAISRPHRNGQKHFDQNRPKWGYAPKWHAVTASQRAEIKRVQTLLRELGPTLVERGDLAE